jgi:hypothetical protein
MSDPMEQVPEAVRAVMWALADGARDILGERLLGLYLGGSASMGDFCEASSDVDFLAVTDGPPTVDDLDRLGVLHDRLRQEVMYGDRLEGEYAPRDQLIPAGTLAPVPGVYGGRLDPSPEHVMISADNHANIREHGIAFVGPTPAEIVPAVSAEDVRAAVREMLAEGPDPAETPAEAAAEILNLARSLCTIEAGRPATKSEGAARGLAHLDARWHPTLRAALAVRAGAGGRSDEARVLADLPELYAAILKIGDATQPHSL